MRIGLIAPPWLNVPPTGYGGIEAVVDSLARGFRARGHDVMLAAAGGSTCPVTVLETSASPPREMGSAVVELRHAAKAYEGLADCDIIHDHTLLGPAVGAATSRSPIVSTIHSDLSSAFAPVYAKAAIAGVHHVFISENQRRSADFSTAAPVIHHGLEVERYRYSGTPSSYVLFLGRMHPDKGLHSAIEAARRAQVPLLIAAKMRDPGEYDYFTTVVKPQLGSEVEYVGEASCERKIELLGRARALLFPVQWPEPFGLVMIEALACGTPVVAYPNGSVSEVVQDHVTGYVVQGIEEMSQAIGRIDDIDRAACRASVERHFSADRMVDDHLDYFGELLAAQRSCRTDAVPLSADIAG